MSSIADSIRALNTYLDEDWATDAIEPEVAVTKITDMVIAVLRSIEEHPEELQQNSEQIGIDLSHLTIKILKAEQNPREPLHSLLNRMQAIRKQFKNVPNDSSAPSPLKQAVPDVKRLILSYVDDKKAHAEVSVDMHELSLETEKMQALDELAKLKLAAEFIQAHKNISLEFEVQEYIAKISRSRSLPQIVHYREEANSIIKARVETLTPNELDALLKAPNIPLKLKRMLLREQFDKKVASIQASPQTPEKTEAWVTLCKNLLANKRFTEAFELLCSIGDEKDEEFVATLIWDIIKQNPQPVSFYRDIYEITRNFVGLALPNSATLRYNIIEQLLKYPHIDDAYDLAIKMAPETYSPSDRGRPIRALFKILTCAVENNKNEKALAALEEYLILPIPIHPSEARYMASLITDEEYKNKVKALLEKHPLDGILE